MSLWPSAYFSAGFLAATFFATPLSMNAFAFLSSQTNWSPFSNPPLTTRLGGAAGAGAIGWLAPALWLNGKVSNNALRR